MIYDELPHSDRLSYRLDQLIHAYESEIAPEIGTDADMEMLYAMRGLRVTPNDCACCGEEIPDGTRTAGSEMCDECYAQIWEDQEAFDREEYLGSAEYEADRAADRYEANYTGM